MAAEILASLGIFRSLYDSAKALKDINDAAIRNAAVVELTEKILAAQAAQAELVEHVRDLEKEITRFETWEAEKKRYQLTDFGGETFAYLLKPEMSNGEPAHRLCAPCYEKGEKSILHRQGTSQGQEVHKCPGCKTIFHFGSKTPPSRPEIIRGRRSWMGR